MAETNAAQPHDFAPDLFSVKSRVSWGAIFAGAVIAMACYLVLTLLFGAIGVSLTETGIRENAIGIGVVVAMVLSLIVSLFLGGWVAAQLTAGENHREAAIYGLLAWAVFMGISLWFVGVGVRTGYFAAVGGAVVVQQGQTGMNWEEAARRAGVSQQRIDDAKAGLDPNRARELANDPQNQERARETATAAAWTALVGTMLSMAASVCGAMVGCGPSFRLFGVAVRRRDTGETGTRLIIPTT
jgi:multidrug efflux pump subunit AcrB